MSQADAPRNLSNGSGIATAESMLIASREALIRIANHAWNVYPLEALGYLLGNPAESEILAALPLSKTSVWYDHADRWTDIADRLTVAETLAYQANLSVIGFYASTQIFASAEYPNPEFLTPNTDALVALYHTTCCKGCSGLTIRKHGKSLQRNEGFSVSPGRRLHPTFNQKRLHSKWLRLVGHLDYTNGYVVGSAQRC